MRGKAGMKILSMDIDRITPAYAGKSNNGYDSGMIK